MLTLAAQWRYLAKGQAPCVAIPRVRKLARDRRVATLVTISEKQQQAQPNRQILEPNRK
jgi:hypothetical protein